MARRLVAFALLALTVASGLVVSPQTATAYPGAPWFEPSKPYTANFPDPMIVRDGATYYAYATNTGGAFLPAMSSTDLQTWTARPAYTPPACQTPGTFNDALVCAPSWAYRFSTSHPRLNTGIQAPGVIKNGSTWLAYYTVLASATERKCISVATSSSPMGPFVDNTAGPLVCDSDPGGSIDPEPFRDADGSLHLVWKSEGVPGSMPTRLWSRRLAADGRSFAPGSAPIELLRTAMPWEEHVIENPSMVRWNGQLYLFYSAHRWQSRHYAMGYAVCSSVAGPCVRPSAEPLLESTAARWGPGGGSAFVDASGRLRLAYHWWNPPYEDYPAFPDCLSSGTCETQGQRRLGITGVVVGGDGRLTTEPVGSLDSVSYDGVSTVVASGWTLDPDTANPIQAHVYVDGAYRGQATANRSRPDVGAAHPGLGADHGYELRLSGIPEGDHRVCVFALNVDMGNVNPQLGCRNVRVEPEPPTLPPGPLPPLATDTGFNPLAPARVLDTRIGEGFAGGPLRDDWTIPLDVTGTGGVPDSGVGSVLLNVTVDQPSAPGGHLTVFPCGGPAPLASNLNFTGSETVPNLVSVRVGAEGKVCLYSNRRTHVIADVVGWYDTDGAGARLVPHAPTRILDTRSGDGLSGQFGSGQTRTLQVTGQGGVPTSGVSAVAVNMTVTEPTAVSYLTVFPGDGSQPVASNLNWAPGDTRANLVVVPVAPDGTIKLYNNSGKVHVVGDVVGWFADEGARFTSLTPARIADTRTGLGFSGKFAAGQIRSLLVGGQGGVPAAGAQAVVVNVTATETNAHGFLTVFPSGAARPLASNLNWAPGQTRPNLVIVPVGTDGRIDIYNNAGLAHVVVDVVGWYG